MRPRVAVALIVGVPLVAVLSGLHAGDVWRSAYPHLPRRVQGAPYRIRAAISWPTSVPVGIPTAEIGVDSLDGWPTVLPPAGAPSPAAAPRTARAGPGPTTAAAPPQTTPTTVPEVAEASASGQERLGHVALSAGGNLAVPPSADLGAFTHEYQTWNNCGPATISMALGYWGVTGGQAEAATRLKPDPDDKNVSPDELVRYVRERGMAAVVRVNGSMQRLKALLALGIPVVVETWFVPEPGDEMGHYRVLTGYSDAGGAFDANDSYNGPEVRLPYEAFDAAWRAFDRVYVPVYPPDLDADIIRVLGSDADDRAMYVGAVAAAQEELAAAPDPFGWFNLGAGMLGLGDAEGAAGAFDRARALGLPWRLLWYRFEPFEAYSAVGRWSDVAALADANLRNAGNLEESLYWRGRALAAAGDVTGAESAWRRALELNPFFAAAGAALEGIEPRD